MKKKHLKSSRLSQLVAGITDVTPAQDCVVTGLSLNSKKLQPGEVFVALSGMRRHGADFILQAVDAGASAVLCEQSEGLPEYWELPIPVLVIAALDQQLGRIASRFYGHPSRDMTIVGVTGTNGKTTCTQLLAQALSDQHLCGVIGTLGYGLYNKLENGLFTTPNAIEVHRLLACMRDAGASYVVMEVSSHGLEQGRVGGVAFDVAVFTNLTRDHLDYHGDMKNYGAAKKRLFKVQGLKHAVVNTDDAFGRALLRELTGHMGLTAYSLELEHGLPDNPLISGSDIQLSRDGFSMWVRDAKGSVNVKSSLLGRFNAGNLLAVYGVLSWLGFSRHLIAARLQKCTPVLGRMERFNGEGLPLVVVDYAHTPDAIEQALNALREHCTGKLWCLFGCGGERDKGKRPLMGALAESLADKLILTDDNPRHEDSARIIVDILSGVNNKSDVKIIANRAEAIEYVASRATVSDVVLIAGKGHEDYQLIADETLSFSDRDEVVKQLGQRRELAC